MATCDDNISYDFTGLVHEGIVDNCCKRTIKSIKARTTVLVSRALSRIPPGSLLGMLPLTFTSARCEY